MFEKWFKENNENIYILKEDLDILNSDKDLNILNLYLNLNKKNGEFGIEELLKDMILIKVKIYFYRRTIILSNGKKFNTF